MSARHLSLLCVASSMLPVGTSQRSCLGRHIPYFVLWLHLHCSKRILDYYNHRKHEYGLPPGHHRVSNMVAEWLAVCFWSRVLWRTRKKEPSFKPSDKLSVLFLHVNLSVSSTSVCVLSRLSWLRWSSRTVCVRVWWSSATRPSGSRRGWGPASETQSERWAPESELTDTESKAWRSRYAHLSQG